MALDDEKQSGDDEKQSGDGEKQSGGLRSLTAIAVVLMVIAAAGWFVFNHFRAAPPSVKNASVSAGRTSVKAVSASDPLINRDMPSFNIVRVTRSGTGVITGQAVPNAQVEVLADGQVLGRTAADSKGEWLLIFEHPLNTGAVELSLQSSLDGQAPLASASIVAVVVPSAPKDQFIEGEGEGVVAIMTPRMSFGPSRIMQRPGPATPGDVPGGLGLDTMDYDGDGHAILRGKAPAYSKVRVYLDNQFEGEIDTDQNGGWGVALPAPVTTGAHQLRIDEVAAKGKVQSRIEVPFDRAIPLDPSRAKEKIIVRAGANLWQIARRIAGDGFQYTLIFMVDKDQIKDPDKVYPDQVFDLPAASGPVKTQ